MNAYYYIIEIYVRGVLHLVVEKDEFTQLTEFTEKTKPHRVEKYHDCEVKLYKASTCNTKTQIDNFKARCTDFIKLTAMEV